MLFVLCSGFFFHGSRISRLGFDCRLLGGAAGAGARRRASCVLRTAQVCFLVIFLVMWAGMLILGLGSEYIVGHVITRHLSGDSLKHFWQSAQFTFPLFVTVGLVSHAYWGLLFLVLGLLLLLLKLLLHHICRCHTTAIRSAITCLLLLLIPVNNSSPLPSPPFYKGL